MNIDNQTLVAQGFNDDGSGIQAITDDLDLHSGIVTQIGIIGEQERNIYPDNSIDSSNTINYNIESSLNALIKPELIFMHGMYKIVYSDGTDIPAKVVDPENPARLIDNPKARVLPINYTAGTMFKSISSRINNQTITEGDTLHPYRSDLEEKLFQNESVKLRQNYVRGWMEEGKAYENLTQVEKDKIYNSTTELPIEDPLRGFVSRWLRTRYSQEAIFISPIHNEITQQPKLLPPSTTLSFSFTKQDVQSFNILTDEEQARYRIKITQLLLKTTFKLVDMDILNEIIHVTKHATSEKYKYYRYPITRIKMLQFSKPKGSSNFNENNLLKADAVSPNRIFLVFVDQESLAGHKGKDPLNYANCNIDTYRLTRDGETVNSMVTCNRNKFDFYEPVHYLLKAVNLLPEAEEALGIDVLNFDKRNFILAFNLKNTEAGPLELADIPKNCSLNFECKLKAPSEKTMSMIAFIEYEEEIKIGAGGDVHIAAHGLS